MMLRQSSLPGVVGTIMVCLFGLTPLTAGEIVQHFPANKPATEMRTSWRIIWDVTRHASGGEILYIKEAYFKRGPKVAEIKVLGDCRLAQILVPYNNGGRIYDLSGGFRLESLSDKDLGPVCIANPKLYDRQGKIVARGLVAHELHDDHLRWKNRYGQSRRAQEMHLWSVLNASNYRYIMLYVFRDDGQVGFRLGSTAHNLRRGLTNDATHLHIGCWRLNVELGDAAKNDIQLVRFVSKPGSNRASTAVEDFNEGKEGGVVWNPDEFTRLRIQSQIFKNKHKPANPIAYELISTRRGNPRLYGRGEEFTHKDIWVTNANNENPEMVYRRLTKYADGEKLDGPAVIWHQCAAWHAPRDEDFGQDGYNSGRGAALTAWCGFHLRPRNFFSSTPLYP